MNIQLPILIWTVINFCLLMLVLSKLLFKPILTFWTLGAQRSKERTAQLADSLTSRCDHRAFQKHS